MSAARLDDVQAAECSCTGYEAALRMRIYRPMARTAAPPAVLYLHRGEFLSDASEHVERTATAMAARLGAVVIAPAYTTADRCPFPAAAEDVYAALRWTQETAQRAMWNARHIAVIGEEAGGNLAAAVTMMARDRDGPRIAAQVLVSPMLDPSLSTQSMRQALEESNRCGQAYQAYLPQASDRMHPYAAPAMCSRLHGLPPALILSGQNEAVRDEAEQYGARLIAAGVKTQVVRLVDPAWSALAWREIAAFLAPLLHPARGKHS